MELSNEFDVAAPIDRAWRVLTDLERIAPCLPGAQLLEVEGDEYRGAMKVKVGPIVAQYKGKAMFTERDEDAHRAVLVADGRDTRGQGNASATIEANLSPTATGTHVVVDTDLTITGKVAQFGRGVMADVSTKLMGQFVENLESMVLADEASSDPAEGEAAGGEPDGGEAAGTGAAATVRTIDSPEAAPLDLVGVAGGRTIAKLALPVVVLLVVLVVLVVVLVAIAR